MKKLLETLLENLKNEGVCSEHSLLENSHSNWDKNWVYYANALIFVKADGKYCIDNAIYTTKDKKYMIIAGEINDNYEDGYTYIIVNTSNGQGFYKTHKHIIMGESYYKENEFQLGENEIDLFN